MVNFNLHKKSLFVIAGVLLLSLSLSSCDTLKEKFIRKKKKGEVTDQSFVPVLEPEDYPSPLQNPEFNYKENYDLIKAWYTDVWTDLDNKYNSKITQYTLGQITQHINQMEQLVDAPTQADLVRLASFLDYYKSSLDLQWSFRNTSRIQSDLRAFDRFLRDHLRADRIKGHFVATMPPSLTQSKD